MPSQREVWCGLAGTTSRFLTAYAAVFGNGILIDGEDRLRKRPMRDLHDALRQLGANLEYLGEEDHLPVVVSAPTSTSGSIKLRGDVSSQFISALMLVAPAVHGLRITLTSELVSKPYVDMTAQVMRDFGAIVQFEGGEIVVSDRAYSSTDFVVEPDFSSAAFAIAVGVITGRRVTVRNLGLSQTQGDSYILDIARMMGATVTNDGDDIVVSREPESSLRPFAADLRNCSDLVPIVAVMSLFAHGDSRLDGIGFIRQKESNRLDDLAAELRSAGASITVEADAMVVHGGKALRPAHLSVHEDHRLAMSFAVLGCVLNGIVIDDRDVVSKSWPSFWVDMEPVLSVENI